MIFKKDTVIKPLIIGIYISVTFNKFGDLVSYEEIDTEYLKNVDIEIIKSLIGDLKAGTSGTFKAVLTIKSKNMNTCFNKYNESIYKTIVDCLLDKTYKAFISFVIVGYLDNIDHFDEFYDCTLCKYFLDFDRCPKIKFKVDVNEDEIKLVVSKWRDFYLFNSFIIDGKDIFELYSLSEKHYLNEDVIIWKVSKFKTYVPYICENESLYFLHLPTYYFTSNTNITENVYYSIDGKIIANNILRNINNSLNNKELKLINGEVIKKEVI